MDSYLVLLRVGFTVPVCYQTRGALLPHHFTLTTHALQHRSAVCSLLHWPSAHAAQALHRDLARLLGDAGVKRRTGHRATHHY